MRTGTINIAVLGSGGREHALAWKLQLSPLCGKVFCLPGNGGTLYNVDLQPLDFPRLETWCKANDIKLIVVGPENLLAAGITDYFVGKDILVFGPDAAAAQLESSKNYAKEFMAKYGVATAAYRAVTAPYNYESLIKTAEEFDGKVVIKYDGLAAGKGVFVCKSMQEAEAAIDTILKRYGNTFPVIFEELLQGFELSYIGITDGATVKLFQASQDHKRLLDEDAGPNTGGMGAYTPVKAADDAMNEVVMQQIIMPTMRGLQQEKMNYRGFIYFGVMVQQGKPYLLEYNVRMGDPETEVLLPSLKSDLVELLLSALEGTLMTKRLEFHQGSFVDVVMVAEGYPDSYPTGMLIEGLENSNPDTWVFQAGTRREGNKILAAGGRVLNVVAHGEDFLDARTKAYHRCKTLHFEHAYYRRDIGKKNI